MRRPPYPWLCAVALLGLAGPSCVEDRADLCQTDADCPEGKRCAEVEGVKYCVGDASGGAGGGGSGGGTGGIGGSGGTGGSGGSGGTGGVDRYEAVVEVTLTPSTELVEYLDRFGRQLQQLVFTYASGGEQRRVEVDLAKSTSLPAHPVEARLPLASVTETLNLSVEVLAQSLEGGPAVLATGQTTAEVSAQAKKTELTISLSLNPDFDWDLDGDPDLHDCEPDDPNVFHGAVDVCDGVRTACEDFCFIPLEDAHFVRDLACSTVERKCAAVIEGPSSSVVRIYDPTFPSTPVEVEGISEARGVAWNTFLSATHLMIAEPKLLAFAKPDGKLATGQIGTTVEISGRLHASIQGNIAVVPALDLPSIVVFDPSLAPARTGKVSCGGTGSACSTIALLNYIKSGDGEPLIPSDSNVVRAEAFRLDLLGDIAVHLQFRDFDKIGFLQLSGARVVQESGLLNVLGERRVPRLLASFGGDEWLFVASDALHAAWLQKGIDMSSHGSPKPIGLQDSACAASLDSQRSGKYLLLADDCNGSLWELPLDEEGRPTETEQFVQHPLGEHCNEPFILASLPEADGEPGVTFVGCRGKNHILVLDRS